MDKEAKVATEVKVAVPPIADSLRETLYRRRQSRRAPPVQSLLSRTEYLSKTLLRVPFLSLVHILNKLVIICR